MNLSDLYPFIERHGLTCRGAFHAQADDTVPMLSNVTTAKTVVLIGNIGDAMWSKFSASPEYKDRQADPLDRWSQRILSLICSDLKEYGRPEPLYRPTIFPLPEMGKTCGTSVSISHWAADTSRIWYVACLQRRFSLRTNT